MKKYIYSLISTTLLLTTLSCHKHETIIPPTDALDATDIKLLFKKNIEDIKVIEPINLDDGVNYSLLNKATIKIAPKCLKTSTGEIATGKAELTFLEIYTRGDMLVTNKTTNTNLYNLETNGTERILETAGLYYISVTQNGKELINNRCLQQIITPPFIKISELEDGYLYEYEGKLNNQEDLVWNNVRYTENNYTEPTLNIINYGWNTLLKSSLIYSKDFIYKTVTFKKPTGLTEFNSRIFIAIEGSKYSLGSEKAAIPLNKNVHYILVAANNDDFKYAIKSQNSSDKEDIVFNASDLKDATTKELIVLLNKLP